MTAPYATAARPDTGLYNAKLGIWLFLASEAMLFGALFSCYVFLRVGSASWPHGYEYLNIPLATVNTLVLIASSMTMVMSWSSATTGEIRASRRFLGITILLGMLFLALKGVEYGTKFRENLFPKVDTFLAIYFTLTAVHALHVLGGVLVNAFLWARWRAHWTGSPRQMTNRLEVAGLYWHFVDLVWLFLFPLFYLL